MKAFLQQRKRWILSAALVLLLFLLLHHHPVIVPDDVVSVEISEYAGTKLAYCHQYTSPENLRLIVDTLASMDPRGRAKDIQITGGSGLIVALQTADGERVVYEVFDGRWDHYLRMGKNEWYDISRWKCNSFCALAEKLTPDAVIQ